MRQSTRDDNAHFAAAATATNNDDVDVDVGRDAVVITPPNLNLINNNDDVGGDLQEFDGVLEHQRKRARVFIKTTTESLTMSNTKQQQQQRSRIVQNGIINNRDSEAPTLLLVSTTATPKGVTKSISNNNIPPLPTPANVTRNQLIASPITCHNQNNNNNNDLVCITSSVQHTFAAILYRKLRRLGLSEHDALIKEVSRITRHHRSMVSIVVSESKSNKGMWGGPDGTYCGNNNNSVTSVPSARLELRALHATAKDEYESNIFDGGGDVGGADGSEAPLALHNEDSASAAVAASIPRIPVSEIRSIIRMLYSLMIEEKIKKEFEVCKH